MITGLLRLVLSVGPTDLLADLQEACGALPNCGMTTRNEFMECGLHEATSTCAIQGNSCVVKDCEQQIKIVDSWLIVFVWCR